MRPAIEPNTGSAGLVEIMSANLVLEPGGNETAMVLSSLSQSAPISFTGDASSAILGIGPDFDAENLQEVGTLPVFSQTAGTTEALGNFIVRESASAIALTAAGAAAGQAPAEKDLATATRTGFTLKLAGGASLECSVGLSSEGVMVITAPDGVEALDLRQVVMMGMQVLRQELKQELGQVKAVVVVKAGGPN
jgi:hypothetical protein